MLGCYDFCGHYDWTFHWLETRDGHPLVREYWNVAMSHDSSAHARALILGEGFEGMLKYWGHTLLEESPSLGYSLATKPGMVRIDMSDCPSKGFLIRNEIGFYKDYCDHCIGWIGPMMKDAGFVIDHEHNHCGQCWWEMRKAGDPAEPSLPGEIHDKDARVQPGWKKPGGTIDRYRRATDPDHKIPNPEPPPQPPQEIPTC